MEGPRKIRMAEAGIVGFGGTGMGERLPCVLLRSRMLGMEQDWLGGQPSHCGPKYAARIGRMN